MTTWDREAVLRLRTILANLYPTVADARRLATDSGLDAAHIEFDNKVINTWFNILQHATTRSKVNDIVLRALEENPDNETLLRAQKGSPPPTISGPDVAEWNGPPSASTLEKIIGKRSTLVQISYLEVGLVRARSVVRVKRADGSSGTGFVSKDNLLITNNHVIPDSDIAGSSIVQFNYQQTADGLAAGMEEARLAPSTFFVTSPADDWTAVKIEGDPTARWGMISIGARPVKVGDHVNIIQHPGGGPKQLSLFANVVVFVGNGRVQYLTDTLPGSSGSPVFDASWNVVALHHSGGWLTEPNAASKSTHYRNEGISIDRVVEGLTGRL